MRAVAALIALAASLWFLAKSLPPAVHNAIPRFETTTWFRHALPVLGVAGLQVVMLQADVLMLGSLGSAEAAGVFSVVKKVSGVLAVGLSIVNMPLGPLLADLYARQDMSGLQRLVFKSARVVLLLTVPMGCAVIGFGDDILRLLGEGFSTGSSALIILAIGQVINAAMGSVMLLLLMTGHERDAMVGVGIAAALNVALNLLLIPIWDIDGAAIATAVSMIVWNIVLFRRVRVRLGIVSTALHWPLISYGLQTGPGR